MMKMPVEEPVALSIESSEIEVFRDRTAELLIRGSGFNKAGPPELFFEHAFFRGVKADVRRM